ncbi:OLC1v1025590C1 [Oldenlandia corymbosa var. corymbosa]|uniref:OLC1v1025590C1 n=1 Tax=Oldenlandia corymbosa var. corymbosa TaxID=529605 RepID=A0AAV1C6X4_OLDCO|nr:OLC1v1025590C1 [Oldenlandia corymbosa var. corymbosa]
MPSKMSSDLEIQVLNSKLIKPSNPTPPHLQKLYLSLFDQLVPPVYFSIILYYSGPPPSPADDRSVPTIAETRARLEKTLSEELPSFFPLAGRFIQDDFSIDCNDQGVAYSEAQVSSKLSDFLRQGPRIEYLDKLLPWESPPASKSDASPLLGIQVNTFDCGSLVLGISISHIIADAASLGQFLNSWARSSQNCSEMAFYPSPNFHHDIAVLFPARTSAEDKATLPLPPTPKPKELQSNNSPDKIVTTRLLFGQETITKIKENAAKSKGPDSSISDIKSSKVVIALALLWKSFMSLAAGKHGYTRDSVIAIAMNIRGKLSLQIPETCFGNFCVSIVVPFEANKNGNKLPEVYDLISLLTEAIRDMNNRIYKAKTVEEVSSILIESRRGLTQIWDQERNRLIDVYRTSSWRGFPLYEVDFGWGKPFWTSVATQWGQGVWLMDANNGDGIEVWVSLKEEDMAEFKRNPDILALPVPTSVV